MATTFNYRELLAISDVRRLVKLHDAGGLVCDDQMVAQLFVQDLVLANCPSVIAHCASLLPSRFHTHLRQYLKLLHDKDYFGEITAMAPGPTAEQQAALQPIFKLVADALSFYLDDPIVPADIPDVDIDQSWIRFHEQPRRKDVRCKHDDCVEEAMAQSVMCPRHHYEMLHGHLPHGLE